MSLIQDALKRKTEESPSNLPPAMQKQTTGTPTAVKGPKPKQVALLLLLLTLFLAVPLGYSIYLIKPKHKPAPVVVKKEAVAAPAILETVPVPPAPVQTPEISIEKIAVEPVVEEKPVQEIKPVWPNLKLTGIASSGSQRIAIINGKMLYAGRTIGEVTIQEVRDTDIIVEFQGERRVLHVDE
ncbi:MAG: general secretion pathway protein GspB [Verrucomicrobia bacterium]|nr:general secretion pathway protein GspB [Verrucomicrobiota bacterium]